MEHKLTFRKLLSLAKAESKKCGRTSWTQYGSYLNGSQNSTVLFQKLEKLVLDSNILDYILRFAKKNFKYTNVAEFSQKIIESKSAEYNFLFAKYVKGANIKAHYQAVKESKDEIWLLIFENMLEENNIFCEDDTIKLV